MFELREEIKTFLESKGNEHAAAFDDETFVKKLAFLADMFTHLNNLNLSIQGHGVNIVIARENLNAFIGKLCLWKNNMCKGNVGNFVSLEQVIDETEQDKLDSDIQEEISLHLQNLHDSFHEYFSVGELQEEEKWVRNPLLFEVNENMAIEVGEQLIEL